MSNCIVTVFIFIFLTISNAKADTISDVVDALSSITCESKALVDMGFHGKFANTCTPTPLSNIAISMLLSPGMFITALTHTKINEPNITWLNNNCTRANRADPANPTITFAMCSNLQLIPLKAIAVAKVTGSAIVALASGDNILDEVKKAWNIDPDDYHTRYINKAVGDDAWFFDAAIPFHWQVTRANDKICVSTNGLLGLMPVGCKYIKEPCPIASYNSFMHGVGGEISGTPGVCYGDTTPSTPSTPSTPRVTDVVGGCSGAGACYFRAKEISKTLSPISGPLIFCIREMLVRVLLSDNVCSFEDFNNNPNLALRAPVSTFFQFQQNMQRAVTAFLTLYTIFFGLNILLSVGGEMPSRGEIIMFPIKIILVLYFAVGINVNTGGVSRGFDGMTRWVLPIVFDGANQLASWIMNSGASGETDPTVVGDTSTTLCHFSVEDYENLEDARMMLWDALDCRVSNYLGLNILSDVRNKIANPLSLDSLSFNIPPWMYFLGPAIYTGEIQLIMLVLMYPILVVSVAAYTVNAFVVCMIAITILGVLAPLFIPMALFEYTKGYFDSWVKLLISFVIQPMVVATFMILMFSVYDAGVYTGCRYNVIWQDDTDGNAKKTFTINNDPVVYGGANPYAGEADTDYKKCQRSLGWMLNSPLLATGNLAINAGDNVAKSSTSSSNILSGIGKAAGMFFTGPLAFINPTLIKDLIMKFLTACFLLYVMYNLSSQISGFAADMTEGMNVGSLAIKPQTIMKAALYVADKANAAKGAMSKAAAGAAKRPMAPIADKGGPAAPIVNKGGPAAPVVANANLKIDETKLQKAVDIMNSPEYQAAYAADIQKGRDEMQAKSEKMWQEQANKAKAEDQKAREERVKKNLGQDVDAEYAAAQRSGTSLADEPKAIYSKEMQKGRDEMQAKSDQLAKEKKDQRKKESKK